ncbi:MAG: hypothetical protein EB078_01635 [Proteobacteria bacterium]|nr:hypothetical protein [Pseudomonadota bacterium]
MMPKHSINQIIGEIDNNYLFTYLPPEYQKFKIAEKLNSENTLYSELIYKEGALTIGESALGDKLMTGLKELGLPFAVYEGEALMERLDYNLQTFYRKDPIFKIRDEGRGFSMEFRDSSLYGDKAAYVLFFRRDKEVQGNFYEFKRFVLNQMRPLLFDHAGYGFIMGKAVWSSNSEIRFTHRGDFRKRQRKWEGKNVSGLKYLYLKMGFRELPDDPSGDYVVLAK